MGKNTADATLWMTFLIWRLVLSTTTCAIESCSAINLPASRSKLKSPFSSSEVLSS